MTFKELEQLVCGKKTIDIDLLKSYTVYSMELTAESNRNKWLWEILSEISEEEKVKFIKFCWGQERLPATKEEYEKLQINFKIKPHIDKKRIDIFPKADTCFFSLELPEYSSKEIMKKLIVTAINYDNISINADKITTENFDHRRGDHQFSENYDYDSE
jgi:other hect domain ubiquitin protein ligase E3